jgi:hypothetical protein
VPDSFFVPYPLATRILRLLVSRVVHPNPFRPLGALLLGDPANGKSFLLRALRGQITEMFSDGSDPEVVPTVFFDAPSGATRYMLFNSLAEAVGVPLPSRGGPDRFLGKLLDALHGRQVKVILVDELNNLLSGPTNHQRRILDDLKTFSNKLGIPVIIAGTTRAFHAVQTDRQYLDRWPPLLLPNWAMGKDFLGLLLCLETEMGVAEGTYTAREPSELILKLSTGLIGRVVQVLNDSFQDAQESGSEGVTHEHIHRAGFTDLPWIQSLPGRAK